MQKVAIVASHLHLVWYGSFTWKARIFLKRKYVHDVQFHSGVEHGVQTPVERLVVGMLLRHHLGHRSSVQQTRTRSSAIARPRYGTSLA